MRGFQQGWNIEAGSRADLEARGLLGEPGPSPAAPSAGARAAAARPRDRGARRQRALRRRPSEITVDLHCGGLGVRAALPARRARGLHRHGLDARAARGARRRIPDPGRRGVFERGAVRIESDDGEVLAERDDPRAAFRRLRRNLWWDDLDLLYFAGYALWGYVSAPFIFTRPGFEVEEIEPWHEDGETLARAARPVSRTTSPPTRASSSTTSTTDGLIRRNDYTAEVFGVVGEGGALLLGPPRVRRPHRADPPQGDAARGATGKPRARRRGSCRSRSTTSRERRRRSSGRRRSCRRG